MFQKYQSNNPNDTDEFIKIKKEASTENVFQIKKEQFEPVFEHIEKVPRQNLPNQSKVKTCTITVKIDKTDQEKKIESLTNEKQKLMKEIVGLRLENQQSFLQAQKKKRDFEKQNNEFDLREKSYINQIAELKNIVAKLKADKHKLEGGAKKNENAIADLTNRLKNETNASNVLRREKKMFSARLKQVSLSAKQNDVEDNLEDDNVFEAENIIGHKMKGAVQLYRIRWKGYGAKDDTWEPKENLFCSELLQEYTKNHPI